MREASTANRDVTADGPLVRLLVIAISVTFLGIVLFAPVILVFAEAIRAGVGSYIRAVTDPDTLAALQLTLLVAAISVPLNVVFGVAAAWAIAKFDFRGKALLLTLIDLPFAVSPVVAGLIFVLLFGSQSLIGPWLTEQDVRILFAAPSIIITTLFITFPFVARELVPLMQSQGNQEEEAALSLGASGLRTFLLVTLPNVRWGLLYGVLLCNARAMGEFGAVSIVSGHIIGLTNTLPLHIEILYNDNQAIAAFSVASLLAILGVVTLAAKTALESRFSGELRADHGAG